jgi:hypothetical protein
MKSIKVFIEIGKKKAFAGALDWPGWCRSSRDENAALQALVDYGPRFEQVVRGRFSDFQIPTEVTDLVVLERHDGNATTDFGAPAILLDVDREPVEPLELERLQSLLLACWRAFDRAVERAAGRALRKGPRGGGRDLETMVQHVLEADREYLKRLAWKQKKEGPENLAEKLQQMRQETLNALGIAAKGDLPKQGPRGGVIWPLRYFVRRVAWHVLDHAWEIEDRVE